MPKIVTKDIELTRGDDEAYLVRFAQSVQGSTLFMTVKRNLTDADSAAAIRVTSTPIAPDYTEVLLTLPHSATSQLTGRSYVYDLQWVDASGSVKTIIKGKVTVDLDVTVGITP